MNLLDIEQENYYIETRKKTKKTFKLYIYIKKNYLKLNEKKIYIYRYRTKKY